jgi:sporulation protein YlmC with PRC-barrel domain
VASEERLRELEEKYEGYTVYDNRGDKIGKVDDLFIDEADREEYIGVKMGFLGRKSTLIPMDIVRVNEADRAIEVSESKDHVKDAPSFDDDEDITPEYEKRIRSHFGLQSHDASGSRSPYAGSSGTAGAPEGRESDRDHSSQEYQDRDDSAQGDRTDGDSSGVDTEYGERTGSSTGSTAGDTGGAAGRFERGSSTEGSAGSVGSRTGGKRAGRRGPAKPRRRRPSRRVVARRSAGASSARRL